MSSARGSRRISWRLDVTSSTRRCSGPPCDVVAPRRPELRDPRYATSRMLSGAVGDRHGQRRVGPEADHTRYSLAKVHAYPTVAAGAERQPVIDERQPYADRRVPAVVDRDVSAGDVVERGLEVEEAERCPESIVAECDSVASGDDAEWQPHGREAHIEAVGEELDSDHPTLRRAVLRLWPREGRLLSETARPAQIAWAMNHTAGAQAFVRSGLHEFRSRHRSPVERDEDDSYRAGQTNALMPVMLRPTIKVFISRVPS